MASATKKEVRTAIDEYIAGLQTSLRKLNQEIHQTPELAYEEHHAHDAICGFLESLGISVTRHAYGLSTAFEAVVGDSAGRCVSFNAEYDALWEIGHACGHNLIATASITGFLALAFAIKKFGLPGRAKLLGTPAEEDGGGKIDLIRAGAYEKTDVVLMMHPMAEEEFDGGSVRGIAGRSSIACYDMMAIYRGVSAHASASPWEGTNALDAIVGAYINISMLRQQMRPDERVHGAITQAPSITNAIPELTRTKYTIRSRTMDRAKALGGRVRRCLEAAALATGCELEVQEEQIYADLIVNPPLCEAFRLCMEDQGERLLETDEILMAGSTDQGNVSHVVPALHALIGIPVGNGAKCHTREFAMAAGTEEAHGRTITAGKAMAMTGWIMLVDDPSYHRVRDAFSVPSSRTSLSSSPTSFFGHTQSLISIIKVAMSSQPVEVPVVGIADFTPETARQVRRKVDLILLPMLGVCFFLQFLDKQTLSYSSLLGLLQDTNLHGKQFSWTASIFYFGYMFWSYPTAYLAVRMRIGKYLAGTVVLWAGILMCHAACHNFGGLMAVRFFLGAFEAAIAPGFSLVMGTWYTRREQPLRYGLWFCGAPFATLLGGVISYGIGHIEGSLASWKLLFLIFGAVTAAWGLVALIFLPDSPANAFWLSKSQRKIAAHRVLVDSQGNAQGSYQRYQVVEAFKDPATWFLMLYTFSVNIANGGLTAFGSLVVQGFGYKGLQALLIQMPSGAAQLSFVLISAALCSWLPNIRTLTMIILTLISVVGMLMMYALDHSNQSGRLAGFCLSLAFSANMPLAMSLITSNVAGYTKRSVVNACVSVMYCVGNIVGPQFFSVDEAPNYPRGIRASIAGFCLGAFWLICLRVYLVLQNKRRAKELPNSSGTVPREVLMMEDKTDWEIPGGQYVL
ncbi:major facilitator superfamily domain-containing protein [Coniochaeta sp. 2T2.1]|nr:major facilitator superfamily domain-containing protein [Coniochaeta sp. 2T2.1]